MAKREPWNFINLQKRTIGAMNKKTLAVFTHTHIIIKVSQHPSFSKDLANRMLRWLAISEAIHGFCDTQKSICYIVYMYICACSRISECTYVYLKYYCHMLRIT